jgi:hypothetical protein
MECDDPTLKCTYLQNIINKNFIEPLRNGINITSDMLNNIRLCSTIFGWNDECKFDTIYNEHDPFDFLSFLLNNVGVHPIDCIDKITGNNDRKNIIEIDSSDAQTVQNAIDIWTTKYDINNIPRFVIIKISNIQSPIKINNKIKLFKEIHNYHNITWSFHSLMFPNDTIRANFNVVMKKNNEIYNYDDTNYPNIHLNEQDQINNMKNKTFYLFYVKDPYM